MNRKKRIFKILLFISAFLLVTVLAGMILQHYLNDKIKDLFIRELNKQLRTEIQVDQVHLSLFRDFPYASVRFNGIRMKDAVNRPNKGFLMKAETVSLRFSLADLFKDSYSVTNVMIRKASFSPHIYRDGTDNYHFWKKSEGKEGKNFSIDLKKILILDTRISYINDSSGDAYKFMLKDATVYGKFSEDIYALEAQCKLQIENLVMAGTRYAYNQPASLDISLGINNKEGLYELKKGIIELNKLTLSSAGWIRSKEGRSEMDMKISTAEGQFGELVSTLPETYQKKLSDYNFKGLSEVTLQLKGIAGKGQTPSILAVVSIRDGELGRKDQNVSLEHLSFTATYSAGQNSQNEQLSITRLKATLNNGELSGNLLMKGLKSPRISALIHANLELEDAGKLLLLDTVSALKGRLIFDGQMEGAIANLEKPTLDDLERSRFSGKAELKDALLGLKGYKLPMENISGSAAINNNTFQLRNLSFRYGKSDFTAQCTIDNFLGWLLIKNQPLSIEGNIRSGNTDWDELSESTSGSGEYHFQLPAGVNFSSLKVNLQKFTFRKFSATNISANLQLKNRFLTATNILMQSMQGVVSGQGTINGTNPAWSLLQCKAKFSKVNLKMLFVEFGNFGNTDLTSENLDGSITADVIFAATMLPDLNIDSQSVKVHSDIRVENGRLVNYTPLQGLSKFLKVEDLADIRFATLQNQIDISNRIIYIPNMEIKSSALDLSIMGTHTFDNELEYHFSLALADLVAAKFRLRNPSYSNQSEFGPIEDDGRGKTRIFVSMTGTVDNPKFGYDKKAVREKLASEIKNQKSELKDIFRKEFGKSTGDTLTGKQNKKEKEIRKKQEEGKFVIEWDDDKK